MTHWEEWLDVQNGADLRDFETYEKKPKDRFMYTLRDLATKYKIAKRELRLLLKTKQLCYFQWLSVRVRQCTLHMEQDTQQ